VDGLEEDSDRRGKGEEDELEEGSFQRGATFRLGQAKIFSPLILERLLITVGSVP